MATDDLNIPGVKPLIREARARFHDCAEHEDPQRKSSLEAKRFLALDQWADDIKIQRQGGIAIQGMPAQPPRPCLTLDCVSEPHQQVKNAIASADFAVKVTAKSNASDETAEVFEGLIRHIQNQARDDDPIGWAADNATGSGFGWFGVKSDYCDEDSFDQDITLYRIENCLSVYCDPAAVSPTRKDARFMFVTEDVPKEEFKRRWPKANEKALEDFRATGDDKDDWITEKTIRVANYWHVEYETDTLYELPDGRTIKASELGEDEAPPAKDEISRQRKLITKRVLCDTINAVEVLESYEWGGSSIPIIPIRGQHLNVDGKPIDFGVTQRAIGPQKMVNFAYSGAAETVALAPKAPFVLAEGQIEGYDQIWQNANRYNFAYLPYKPESLMGTAVPPPSIQSAEPPIQGMVAVMQMSLDAVRRTTSFDPGLSQMPGRQMSADAIEALQNQGDKAHSSYLDAVRRAYYRLGEVLIEAIPVYYDRPERIIQILDLEDQASSVMINAPHVTGPNGQPMAAPPNALNAKLFDLTKGKYALAVDVGKAFSTRRQEGVQALAEFAKVQPELVPRYADLWVQEMDFPGAQAVAKRLEPPGTGDNQLPPEAQAAIGQLQQENQQLKLAIATKQPELASKERIAAAQTHADVVIAQQKNQTDLQKAEISAAAAMTVGQWKVDAENTRSFVDAFETKLAHDLEFRLHFAKVAADAFHKQQQQTHEAGRAAQDHVNALVEAQQAHEHAIKQAQTVSALTPATPEA